jgi:hypothetical protein
VIRVIKLCDFTAIMYTQLDKKFRGRETTEEVRREVEEWLDLQLKLNCVVNEANFRIDKSIVSFEGYNGESRLLVKWS